MFATNIPNIPNNCAALLFLSSDAEYKLAQSGDATCNGLESAEVSRMWIESSL